MDRTSGSWSHQSSYSTHEEAVSEKKMNKILKHNQFSEVSIARHVTASYNQTPDQP